MKNNFFYSGPRLYFIYKKKYSSYITNKKLTIHNSVSYQNSIIYLLLKNRLPGCCLKLYFKNGMVNSRLLINDKPWPIFSCKENLKEYGHLKWPIFPCKEYGHKKWPVDKQKIHFKIGTSNYKYYSIHKFSINSLKGVLLVNFPEKEKHFLIQNLAAENKIPFITQYASLLLKDFRNMNDLLQVDDPIQALFDKVKAFTPCICFINDLDSIGQQRLENNSFTELMKFPIINPNNFILSNNMHDISHVSNNTIVNKCSTERTPPIYEGRSLEENYNFIRNNKITKSNTIRFFLGHRSKNYQQWFLIKPSIHVISPPNQQGNNIHEAIRKSTQFNIIDQLFFNKNPNIKLLNWSLGYRLPFWLYKKSDDTKLLHLSTKKKLKTFPFQTTSFLAVDEKATAFSSTSLKNYFKLKENNNKETSTNSSANIQTYNINDKVFSPINGLIQKFMNKYKYAVTDKTVNILSPTNSEKNYNQGSSLDEGGKGLEDNLLKMNQTEIIKRTALLKFLQILDGFDSQPMKTNNFFFFNYLYNLITQHPLKKKIERIFLFSLYSWIYSVYFFCVQLLYKKNILIRYSFTIPSSNSLCHNHKRRWPGSKQATKLTSLNSFGFSRIKLMDTPKNILSKCPIFVKPLTWSTYSKNLELHLKQTLCDKKKTSLPLSNSINCHFTLNNHCFTSKKLYLSILQKRLWKDFYYINHEIINHRALNLLCVWPCYNDDILGSSYLNDSGSYILPFYFQLLNIGANLKKSKITLIASTNNVGTLDAALLRPGRFDTLINFVKAVTRESSFTKRNTTIEDPSKVLNFAATNSKSFWQEPPFSYGGPVFFNTKIHCFVMKLFGSSFQKKTKVWQSVGKQSIEQHAIFAQRQRQMSVGNRSTAFKNFLELFMFVIWTKYLYKYYSSNNVTEKQSSGFSLNTINIGNYQGYLKNWPLNTILNLKNCSLLIFDACNKFFQATALNSKTVIWKFKPEFPNDNKSLQDLNEPFKDKESKSTWQTKNVKTKDVQYFINTSLQNQVKTHGEFQDVFNEVLHQHQGDGLKNIFLKSTRKLLFSNGSISKEPLLKSNIFPNDTSSLSFTCQNHKIVSTLNQTSKLAKYNSIYLHKQDWFFTLFQLHSISSILIKYKNELIKPSVLRFWANTSNVHFHLYDIETENMCFSHNYQFKNQTYTSLSQHYQMGLLDTTILLYIFYTMYVGSSINAKRFISRNEYQNQILSTITISMPYKSVLLSHWLLLQNEASNFLEQPMHLQSTISRSIEVLIINKLCAAPH